MGRHQELGQEVGAVAEGGSEVAELEERNGGWLGHRRQPRGRERAGGRFIARRPRPSPRARRMRRASPEAHRAVSSPAPWTALDHQLRRGASASARSTLPPTVVAASRAASRHARAAASTLLAPASLTSAAASAAATEASLAPGGELARGVGGHLGCRLGAVGHRLGSVGRQPGKPAGDVVGCASALGVVSAADLGARGATGGEVRVTARSIGFACPGAWQPVCQKSGASFCPLVRAP